MGLVLKVPLGELVSLRERKNKLLKLNPFDEKGQPIKRLFDQAEQLVREMTAIRFELDDSERADAVMAWEVELFEHFPGIDPDRQP